MDIFPELQIGKVYTDSDNIKYRLLRKYDKSDFIEVLNLKSKRVMVLQGNDLLKVTSRERKILKRESELLKQLDELYE